MKLRQPKHLIMKTKIYKRNPWRTLGCLIAFAIVFLNYSTGFSQCIMPTQYGSATVPAPGAPPVSISTCNFQSEYSPLSGVVAGYTYSCENLTNGGYVTITDGSPTGPVVNHGYSPLIWTATTSGIHYVHWALDSTCAQGPIMCNSTQVSFVSSGSVTLGCTDTAAVNYDSTATINDGSCIYSGCTNVSLQM